MGETLMVRRRVGDEGFRIVKPFSAGTKRLAVNIRRYQTVPAEEAPANSVPAAAVRRREQALFGFTGCKGRLGGLISQM